MDALGLLLRCARSDLDAAFDAAFFPNVCAAVTMLSSESSTKSLSLDSETASFRFLDFFGDGLDLGDRVRAFVMRWGCAAAFSVGFFRRVDMRVPAMVGGGREMHSR